MKLSAKTQKYSHFAKINGIRFATLLGDLLKEESHRLVSEKKTISSSRDRSIKDRLSLFKLPEHREFTSWPKSSLEMRYLENFSAYATTFR